jgi:tetratricopeptide (TPR) repeat protein
VFRGGWTVDAAEAVCGATVDALEGLVAQSLVRRAGERLGFLETIRELADERLTASGGREDVRGRHARWVLDLVEPTSERARGPEQEAWFDRLEQDDANVFAALEYAVDTGDAALGLSIAVALEAFWTRRHHLGAVGPLAALLGLDADVDAGLRGRALGIAGLLAGETASDDRGDAWLAESAALARSVGDGEGAAWALKGVGRLAVERGDLETARTAYEESLALFEQLGLGVPASGRLSDLAYVARAERRFDEARRLLARAVELEREAGDVWSLAGDSHTLGDVELEAGDPEAALAAYRRALETARELNDPHLLAHCLAGVAACAAALGDADAGARIWAAVRRLTDETRAYLEPLSLPSYERALGPLAAAALDGPEAAGAVEIALAVSPPR